MSAHIFVEKHLFDPLKYFHYRRNIVSKNFKFYSCPCCLSAVFLTLQLKNRFRDDVEDLEYGSEL